MPTRSSTVMLLAAVIGLSACGGATWMDVGAGATSGGVGVGTSVSTGAAVTTSPGEAAPASVVTENQLRAEWTAQPVGDRTRLRGNVYNGWVLWARDILLMVDSLDEGGRIVQRTQARLWRPVGPGSSSYFDLNVPAAASYRVQIVGVRWLQGEELRGAW